MTDIPEMADESGDPKQIWIGTIGLGHYTQDWYRAPPVNSIGIGYTRTDLYRDQARELAKRFDAVLQRLEDEVDPQDDPNDAAEFVFAYIKPARDVLAFLRQLAGEPK